MKIFKNLFFCLALGALWLPASAQAAPPEFRIKPIQEVTSQEALNVEGVWRSDSPKRLKITLRVAQSTPGSDIFVKAYFYDKDNNLIETYNAPHSLWTKLPTGTGELKIPATLEPNKDVPVYFALTPELIRKKWKSVVVVFGREESVAARSWPNAVLKSLDFPEKEYVIADDGK